LGKKRDQSKEKAEEGFARLPATIFLLGFFFG